MHAKRITADLGNAVAGYRCAAGRYASQRAHVKALLHRCRAEALSMNIIRGTILLSCATFFLTATSLWAVLPLPRTGQEKCYGRLGSGVAQIPCAGTGQDGDIRAGVPMARSEVYPHLLRLCRPLRRPDSGL
jgi:hypothetical protein